MEKIYMSFGLPWKRKGASACLGLLVLSATLLNGRANPDHEPQILRLEFSDAKTAVTARHKLDDRTSKGTEDVRDYRRERLEFVPSLVFQFKGSVYHPNLLDFSLFADTGLSWEDETLESGPDSTVLAREDTNPLQVYSLDVGILRQKPYALGLSAARSRIRRDNDFFSRFTLESERYGAEWGYKAGPLPFSVSVAHLDETQTDTDRPRTLVEDSVYFRMQNDRLTLGRTDLTFSYRTSIDAISARAP